LKPDLSDVTLVSYENRFPELACKLLADMTALCDFGAVRLLNSFQGYQQFLYWENYETWKHVTTSHALTVHLDGYILRPELWNPEWLNYDYIGAPWPLYLNEYKVGNGGFCLKSRRLMNHVATLPFVDIPGDVLVCTHYRKDLEKAGFNFAPPEVAARFSIEHFVDGLSVKDTFGFHGGWNALEYGATALEETPVDPTKPTEEKPE